MNPQDPLAALQPLREPELIGWWPPAPGWWALLLLLLALLGGAIFLLWQRHRNNAYRRAALQQLEQLHSRYKTDADLMGFVSQTNALLKRVALISYAEREVAARHGAEWARFLNHCGAGALFDEGAMQSMYSADVREVDPERLHLAARSWLKRHRVVT